MSQGNQNGIWNWQAQLGDYLLIRAPDACAEKFYIGKVMHKTKTHYCVQWWVREHSSASPLEAAYLPQENHVGCRRESLEQLPFDAQCIQDILKTVRGAGGEGRRCLSRQAMTRVSYWEHQWKNKNAHDSDSDDDVSFADLALRLKQGDPNSDPDSDDDVPLTELRARQGAHCTNPTAPAVPVPENDICTSTRTCARGNCGAVASSVKEESQENDMSMGGQAMEIREFECRQQTLARCQVLTWGRRGRGRQVTLKLEEGEYIETFADIKDNKLLSYKIFVRGGQGASGRK
jgi:hypothetical protein